MIDAAALLRAAGALAESSAALRRLAPDQAADFEHAADALRIIAAGLAGAPLMVPTTLPLPVPPPPQAPACRLPRLSRHMQVQLARTWFLDREAQFHGRPPPSEARDIEDARNALPGVSRAVIRKHRPIAWQVGRDKKPKSPRS